MRALPRMTIRAPRATLSRFQAFVRITGRPPHEAFEKAVEALIAEQPPESQAAIEREAKRDRS